MTMNRPESEPVIHAGDESNTVCGLPTAGLIVVLLPSLSDVNCPVCLTEYYGNHSMTDALAALND